MHVLIMRNDKLQWKRRLNKGKDNAPKRKKSKMSVCYTDMCTHVCKHCDNCQWQTFPICLSLELCKKEFGANYSCAQVFEKQGRSGRFHVGSHPSLMREPRAHHCAWSLLDPLVSVLLLTDLRNSVAQLNFIPKQFWSNSWISCLGCFFMENGALL